MDASGIRGVVIFCNRIWVNPEQPLNTLDPMVVTLLGIETEVIGVNLNAPLAIVLTVFGMFGIMDSKDNELQPLNAF